MLEKPEPIIFMASLDTVTLKRRKFGVPPEVTVKLSADIRGEDLQHIHGHGAKRTTEVVWDA